MKVAILVAGLPPLYCGGTEVATAQIAKHAAHAGHEIHVLAGDSTGKGYPREHDGYYVHTIRTKHGPYIHGASYVSGVLRAIKEIKPDVLHVQSFYMAPAAFLSDEPYILYERGGVYVKTIGNRLYPMLMRAAERVIAQTEDQKRALLKHCQRDIEVIPNGVEVGRFGQITKCSARATLELPQHVPIVLSVGRARVEKNLEAFIDTAALDFNRLYVLVGDGPELPRLKKIIHEGEMQNVHFAGNVDNEDVPTWMAAADVLVNTSLSEGFPMAVLEGMASGLPIVAPRVTGIPEIVTDYQNGILTDNKPESIHCAIDRLWLARAAMGEANKRKAREYTWGNVVRKLYG